MGVMDAMREMSMMRKPGKQSQKARLKSKRAAVRKGRKKRKKKKGRR